MPRFTSETNPDLTDEQRAVLNRRYDAVAERGDAHDPLFLDRLAAVILEDFQTQRKISEAFTTYMAKGNREDLA